MSATRLNDSDVLYSAREITLFVQQLTSILIVPYGQP